MVDTPAHSAKPQVKRAPSTPSAVVSAQEAQEAIRAAFPYEGDLRVRHLWSGNGVARYRANWFRQVEGEMKVVTSLFIGITRTADGLVVQNETAVG
ncbi:MAG TPA: hypothetical protein PKH07_14430 [bacterium]|nr:hypothetical protein [bacterium]